MKSRGIEMKKSIVVPALCFAVLSTPAFTKAVHAATNTTSSTHTTNIATNTVIRYVNVEKGSSLLLRSKASTTGSILARLSRGTSVTVDSASGDWSKVKVNGKSGYVSSKYLSSTKLSTDIAENTTKYVNVDADSSLLLRQKASTSSSMLSRLKRGTSVNVLSSSGSWDKVTVGGKTGYVHSEYLSTSKVTTSSSSTAAKTTSNTLSSTKVTTSSLSSAKTTTKYVNVDPDSSLLLRQKASTSSPILFTLKRGTSVNVLATSGSWSKVSVVGKTGYVSSTYLSSAKVTTSRSSSEKTVKKYVNVEADSSLLLRQRASTSSPVISRLKRGTSANVLSTSGIWAKVTVSGKTGYVHAGYLSSTKLTSKTSTPSSTGTADGSTSTGSQTIQKVVKVSSGSSLNMRTAPSTTTSVITQLSNGTVVQVISEANGWVKVNAKGKTGYVNSRYLSSTKVLPNKDPSSSRVTAGGAPSSAHQTIHKYVKVSQGSSLNMRKAPSTTASVMTQLSNGTVVQVVSEAHGWAKVSANGKTGYVSGNYLTSTVNNPSNQSVSKAYQSYAISLNNMGNLELKANPQTDKKYNTYVRSDALVVDNTAKPTKGVVFGSNWNVRGGGGTNYWVVGQVKNGTMVQILSSVKGTDGHTWYQIAYNKTWVNASPDDVTYYLNPSHFVNDTVQMFQFLKLSETANLNADEVNQKILAGKGTLAGKAQSFIIAGNTYGMNELYLIAHALLETGNGTSELATGVKYNDRTVYNMYGIGAYDNSPIESGAAFAYNAGWFTPEAAIIGGAQFIDSNYIEKGQDTLYKMKWNPSAAAASNRATHQYATDIGWAYKQVSQIYNLYQLLNTYQIKLDIPEYLK
jgi:mannosyl-glycoprotein endo-beta-N-acetylglucosaminidase